MKTAIFLIPKVLDAEIRKYYLLKCTQKMEMMGYIFMSPSYFELMPDAEKAFVNRIAPFTDDIYFFADLGLNPLVNEVKNPHITNCSIDKYTPEGILNDVSFKTHIPIHLLRSSSRIREVADARKIYFRRCFEKTRASSKAIGRVVCRDHSTVLYGIKEALSIRELDQLYHKLYAETETETEAMADKEQSRSEAYGKPQTSGFLPYSKMETGKQGFSDGKSSLRETQNGRITGASRDNRSQNTVGDLCGPLGQN